MKRLGDIHFAELLPDSIKRDPVISAAAESLNALLGRSILSVPNLLIWARLDSDEAKMMKPLARLAEAANGLKPHSLETLELLAWQLHVDFRDVAETPAMLERMVRESIPWHRIKGTPAAVEQALAMYGIEALTDECGRGANWAVYELELATAPDLADLPKIVRLAGEAAPVRCQLRRLHGDYNLQPIIWGEGPPLGDGYWGDDSGVWDDESGLKLSFREKTLFAGESFFGSKKARAAAAALTGTLINWPGLPVWGRWRFGDKFIDLKRSLRYARRAALGESLEFARYEWGGPWDRRRWERPAADLLDRRLDRFLNFPKSAFIWGESRFGAPLRQISGRGHLSDVRRIIWSEFRYGDSNKDYERVYVKLHELFVEQSLLGIPAVQPGSLKQFGLSRRAEFIVSEDQPCFGRWRFGDKSPVLRRGLQNASRTAVSESLEAARHLWGGLWNRRRWGRSDIAGRRLERCLDFYKSAHFIRTEEPARIDLASGRFHIMPNHVQWPDSGLRSSFFQRRTEMRAAFSERLQERPHYRVKAAHFLQAERIREAVPGRRGQSRPGHIQWTDGGLRPRRWQGSWQGRWRPPVYMQITNIGE